MLLLFYVVIEFWHSIECKCYVDCALSASISWQPHGCSTVNMYYSAVNFNYEDLLLLFLVDILFGE